MKQSKGVCLSVDLEDIVISAQDRLIDEGYVGSQFKRSADQLVQSQIDGGDILHPDGLFMPITYLYRHCIELKLKALLRTIGECDLSEYDESLLTRHDLIKLWQAGN